MGPLMGDLKNKLDLTNKQYPANTDGPAPVSMLPLTCQRSISTKRPLAILKGLNPIKIMLFGNRTPILKHTEMLQQFDYPHTSVASVLLETLMENGKQLLILDEVQ